MAKRSLCEAIKKGGDLHEVRRLLADGANPNDRDLHGYSPLRLAIRGGQMEIARELIARGADLSEQRKGAVSVTLIEEAAEHCCLPMVNFLIKRGAGPDSLTAALYALTCAQYWLLDRPGRPRRPDSTAAIAQVLIEHGADVNHNRNGRTPLLMAADEGATDVAEVLLRNGADVNATLPGGATPLHRAVAVSPGKSHIWLQMIELLIRYGAEPSALDHDGLTPFDLFKRGASGVMSREDFQIGAAMLKPQWWTRVRRWFAGATRKRAPVRAQPAQTEPTQSQIRQLLLSLCVVPRRKYDDVMSLDRTLRRIAGARATLQDTFSSLRADHYHIGNSYTHSHDVFRVDKGLFAIRTRQFADD